MKAAVAAAARIVADSAIYRVRRREGGNLVTSMTLALALALPWRDVAWRLGFGVLLNLFVYLLNDCYDVRLDLAAQGRDRERTLFLSGHLRAGWGAVMALGAVVALVGALHGYGLLFCFVLTALVIAAYSPWLKKRPLLDVLAMGLWGLSMAMVGFPLDSRRGWWLAGLLALLCMVTEVVQVIRDEATDRLAGIRTTAVAFGTRAAGWLARLLIVCAAAYSTAFLHRWIGLALLAGALVPLTPARTRSSWDMLRALFGLGWLAILLACYRAGALGGWLAVE
jgi:4-hydroxybenzoate polyprenyltransferase